jgi:hypothetical protein
MPPGRCWSATVWRRAHSSEPVHAGRPHGVTYMLQHVRWQGKREFFIDNLLNRVHFITHTHTRIHTRFLSLSDCVVLPVSTLCVCVFRLPSFLFMVGRCLSAMVWRRPRTRPPVCLVDYDSGHIHDSWRPPVYLVIYNSWYIHDSGQPLVYLVRYCCGKVLDCDGMGEAED